MYEAQAEATATNGHVEGAKKVEGPPQHRLDLPKLHSLPSEQQDLYLFTFTVELESYTNTLDHDAICVQQSDLAKELVQIITLASPAPSKAVRKNLGRSYGAILERGNRKILFESVNQLSTIISAGKGEKELQNKHAAVHCLGEIYQAAGDSAINLSSLACSSLLRLLKPAQNHAGLRAAIFRAFGKINRAIQGSIEESIARDVWKQARTAAATDKAALVQVRACGCLEQLVTFTTYFDSVSDFDSLKTSIWKACDNAIPAPRHAAASCLASSLVKSYSETVPSKSSPKTKKPKKSNRTQQAVLEDGDEDASSRPGSPVAKKAATKLELSLADIFRQLSSQYHRPTTNNRTRAGIVHCYVKVLKGLNPSIIENNYGRIVNHLFSELLSSPTITHDRYRLLLTRKFVQKILSGCIGSKILGESGRLNAARTLINGVLKNYPQLIKEVAEPSKHALVGALDALAAIIKSLGPAFISLGDNCREALIQVLAHPSYTVQIHASHCIRAFVLACPQQLLSCASICMNSVSRELSVLATSRQSPRRCVGYANGLAAVLSISPSQPLYSSLEICSKVLSTATELLKSSSNAELRVAGTQVQVAWILIGGLMALGPNFVKIHLSQFLLLWRNALPKPLTRGNTAQRQSLEISYLTHVRECTLGSILSFMEFNTRLITSDVAKRIASMLQNTFEYLDNLPNRKQTEEASSKLFSSLKQQDLVLMVRRRVFQCYSKLISCSPHASGEILTQSNLLTYAVTLFADPESYAPGTLSSSIANAAGTFESIWDVADNSGFGITGLVRTHTVKPLPIELSNIRQSNNTQREAETLDIDGELLGPVCGAQEHDSVSLYARNRDSISDSPDPPATEVVNSAIVLFATALPLHSFRVQEGVIEQLATLLSSPSLQRDPGRRAAVTVNTAMALLGALKVAVGETTAERGDLRHATVERTIEEILRGMVADQDRSIRAIAYEALGRLCNSSGNTFTTSEVNALIGTIVSNRDPNARAGCAMALGTIHAQVGGMAAGLHLKKIHGVLMSLCSDPNPVVHYCAIEALSQVADSAGLTFSGYVSSTLGLLAQLWSCDSHNDESASLLTSNVEIDWPTAVAIAHSTDALINVLGPDLQDMGKTRELMLMLMKQFALDDVALVQAENLRAWEHMNLYDSAHVDLSSYVLRLQEGLDSDNDLIRDIAVDGLYNLMRRDAETILAVGRDGLEDQIWLTLNDNPSQEGVRNLIQSWLGQSSLAEAEKWVVRCHHVLTKIAKATVEAIAPTEAKTTTQPDLQDEEVAGFNVSDGKDQNSTILPEATQELLRWQTRAFALQCLSDLVAIIGKDMDTNPDSAAGHALQNKIADVIRLAFLASTASVVELQVLGLRLIDQILRIFGSMPDPDFSEALLLEQYQAQVSSALTPAFGSDSSPDLAAAAVDVCATFISAGLVTDVDRMGRILKLLVTALETFTDELQDSAIGDLRGLSPNAQTMVRMAVLSAWAQLQVASIDQQYLIKVMKPHVAKLAPLWLSSLQEFARLRFEPDISNNTGPARPDEGLDVVYAALNRQTLLKFYQDSWLKLVDAIASLIDQDSKSVFDALDGKTGADPPRLDDFGADRNHINYRDEPTAFFFILFGIVIEALTTHPSNDGAYTEAHTLDILSALKRILRPSVSGNAVFQDAVFAETTELFDRLALTEGPDVQLVIVQIARNLCLAHPSAREEGDNSDHLSDDIEQLFELTRIIVLVLAGVLPNLAEHNPSARQQLPDEAVVLIQTSLEALADASEIFPSIIKADLHASIIHIFATILGTGACQANVVPQAFPVFKRFLQSLIPPDPATPTSSTRDLVRGCLHRFLSILAHAQRREAETSLPCAKNTLLASSILLSTASRSLAQNDPLIIRTLDEMLDCLQDLGLAKVAASCLRSLLMVSPKSRTDEAIARYLLPLLLRFTADTEAADPENARSLTAHALTSFASSTASEASSAAMCMVIPVLLTRASAEGKVVYVETANRLLELAGGNQIGTFRGVVAKMSPEQRGFMETVIREGGAGGGGGGGWKASRGEKDEPSIALKLDFGGK